MLYILSGIKRSDNQWVYRIVDSVKKVLSQRRIDFIESSNADETIEICSKTSDVILLPLNVTSYTLEIVEKCNRAGVQVILPNAFLNIGEHYRCHCVQGDIYGIVVKLLNTFRSAGKKRIALYGPNTNAQNDVLLTDVFFSQTSQKNRAVFYNEGSAKQCFESFYEAEPFDAVICANDYVAFNLIDNLKSMDPDYLERISIVSFSNTLLSRLSQTPFTSLDPDWVSVANAVADIYRIVNKEKNYYRAVTVYVGYNIHERKTTEGISFIEGPVTYESRDVFYPIVFPHNETTRYDFSPEISCLARTDYLLNKLSKIDLSILMLVLRGHNRRQITEELFLSLEAVNYHMKKMRDAFDCKTTKELYERLVNMLSADCIEDFLSGDQHIY